MSTFKIWTLGPSLSMILAITIMSFADLVSIKQSVKDDIGVFKASPLIRENLKNSVRGYVFDVKTGLLTAIATE